MTARLRLAMRAAAAARVHSGNPTMTLTRPARAAGGRGRPAPHRSYLLRVEAISPRAPSARYVVQDLRTGERSAFDSAASLQAWLDLQAASGLR